MSVPLRRRPLQQSQHHSLGLEALRHLSPSLPISPHISPHLPPVSQVSNLFAVFVISPFVALSVAGVMSGRGLPTALYSHTSRVSSPVWVQLRGRCGRRGLQTAVWTSDFVWEPQPPVRWGTFLSVLLWNTSGYDSVGALAAEVRQISPCLFTSPHLSPWLWPPR